MNTNTNTTFIHHSEPTVRSNASQAYSQCLPESDYGYSPEPNYGYGSYYGEQAPMPQQPVQAPIAQPSSSSSSGKGLLFVAGLAVVGAAAFGGVYLMNSTSSEPTASTSAAPAAAPAPVVNLPAAVDIPALAPAQNVPAPVIVNNPAPIRVSGPVSSPRSIAAPKPITSKKPVTGSAPAAAAAPAPAPAAPAPAPKGSGVAIKTPFADVGVGQNGTTVKSQGVEVGVPGQNGGDVVVGVGGQTQPQTGGQTTPTNGGTTTGTTTGGATTNTPGTGTEGSKPSGNEGTTAEGPKKAGSAIADVAGVLVEAPLGSATSAASGIAGG
jgi:hypothetical protein